MEDALATPTERAIQARERRSRTASLKRARVPMAEDTEKPAAKPKAAKGERGTAG